MSECCRKKSVPPKVKNLLASCTNLPSLPAVVINIIDASKDPDIGLTDIADILRVDPALSARILMIANSSMYARRREVNNLNEALSLLGLNATLNIALSFSLVKSLSNSADHKYNYDKFWKRSILAATIARQIGVELGLKNLEDLFLAGLLQDIGILAIDCSTFDCNEDSCNSTHKERITCEINRLGVDHADIGAWLLESWNLPEKLYKAVLCSHTLYSKPATTSDEEILFQCISLSGRLTDIWFEDNRKEAIEKNLISTKTFLGFNREKFYQFIEDINQSLPEISNLFEIKLFNENKRQQVLNDAIEILMERGLDLIKQIDQQKNKIKALTQKNQTIQEEANHDRLTNTFSRHYIEKLLDEEFRNSNIDHTPLSLAFVDIDNLKVINDRHGHLAGDEVIKDISHFFIQRMRDTDSIARYGGDEFLLLLPGIDSSTAYNLLSRLIAALEASSGIVFEGNKLKASTSIGIATHFDHTSFDTIEDLIGAADKALYKAKQSGKNSIMSFD